MLRSIACVLAAACSASPTPVENRTAVPGFTGCVRTLECIAACKRHDAGACWRAHRLVFYQLDYTSKDDLYEESLSYATLACEAGDARGCVASARIREDHVDDMGPVYAAACDRGATEGCRQAMRSTHTQPAKQGFLERTRRLAEAGCGRGVGDDCMIVAGMYGAYAGFDGQALPELGASEPQVKRYLMEAIAAYEAACMAGDPIACIDRIWVYQHGQLGKQTPHPRVWADRACKLVGAAPKCWHGDEPTLSGYEMDDRL